MKKLSHIALTGAFVALSLASAPQAFAQSGVSTDGDRWQVRVRAIGVVPDESSTVNIGGDANVGNALVPELDISYFFTKNIAAELILGTARHKLSHSAAGDLGKVWILPPTLTLQYHFTPDQKFSPYVGAGLNYSMFYSEKAAAGFTDLKVDGGVGYALQAGFDYWLDDRWGLNLDVKKIWLDVDAKLNNGTVRADVDLDPWIFGAGVSYRF